MIETLRTFIGIMGAGVKDLAGAVAEGIVEMATQLFLTTNTETGAITGLSNFGGLVALFAGVALAVGLTSKVFIWVSRLGK